MSYGVEQWGIGSWGGSDFVVTNHTPSDFSTNVGRLPIIGCVLLSQSGNVVLASINLTANGVSLITNGAFTVAATGTIDNTNPSAVQITAQLIHEFSPLEIVTIVVSAVNTANQPPIIGNIWQFTVDSTIHSFQNYIVRKFERVFRVGAAAVLTSPQNVQAIVELKASTLSGVII